MKLSKSLLLPVCLLPLQACIFKIGSGGSGWWDDYDSRASCRTVNNVELRHHHCETLAFPAAPESGLSIAVDCGDIEVERTGNLSTLTVELWESTPGDAYAVLEGGKLVARTKSGQPCSIGDVDLDSNLCLSSLDAHTGMGDVSHCGVPVTSSLTLGTGMGDVCVRVLAGEAALKLDSGMGDVCLHDAAARSAALSSGMGDVLIEDATLQELNAQTGMGDVHLVRTLCPTPKLSSGMGDVEID